MGLVLSLRLCLFLFSRGDCHRCVLDTFVEGTLHWIRTSSPHLRTPSPRTHHLSSCLPIFRSPAPPHTCQRRNVLSRSVPRSTPSSLQCLRPFGPSGDVPERCQSENDRHMVFVESDDLDYRFGTTTVYRKKRDSRHTHTKKEKVTIFVFNFIHYVRVPTGGI